jgi:hypothetical protein
MLYYQRGTVTESHHSRGGINGIVLLCTFLLFQITFGFAEETLTTLDGNTNRIWVYPIVEGGEHEESSSLTHRNECHDDDTCTGYLDKYRYVTTKYVMDHGFVMEYPRKFVFPVNKEGLTDYSRHWLVVEIDNDTETNKLTMQWCVDTPNANQVQWIQNELQRLWKLHETVYKDVDQQTMVDFYHALTEVRTTPEAVCYCFNKDSKTLFGFLTTFVIIENWRPCRHLKWHSFIRTIPTDVHNKNLVVVASGSWLFHQSLNLFVDEEGTTILK